MLDVIKTHQNIHKKIILNVNDDGKPSYKISVSGESMIKPSRLGLVFKDVIRFSDGFTISSSQGNCPVVWQ